MKWKPEEREKFYFFSEHGYLGHGWWCEERYSGLYEFGNCFRTRKQARQMAKKIKEMLKGREVE